MKVIFEMDDEVEVGKPVRMERVGELVECKDCRHHTYCDTEDLHHDPKWYCADGVKR